MDQEQDMIMSLVFRSIRSTNPMFNEEVQEKMKNVKNRKKAQGRDKVYEETHDLLKELFLANRLDILFLKYVFENMLIYTRINDKKQQNL